jgi:uncharacterized membrane protein
MFFHIFQADQFSRAIQDGVFYPRWVPDANNGYGSPTFVFYAPLSYYFVAVIQFIIPSLTFSMIIVIWCGFFLSGVTMFIATAKIFGKRGGLISAIFYQILPFHLRDLYARGTFAELFSFIFFPIIIFFLHHSFESRNKTAIVGLSISYAGLILTHLVSGFIFSFVIGAYLIYFYVLKKRKYILQTFFSLILGLGLSALYLIPVIFEQKYVQIDQLIQSIFGDYRKNFLFSWDKFQGNHLDFYLPLHIGVVLEIMLFLLIVLLIYKNRKKLSVRPHQNFFILLFLSAFLLTTSLSRPVWGIMPGFPLLQFPWRWIPVMELSLCFLIGIILTDEGGLTLRSNDMGKKAIIYLLVTISIVSLVTIFKSSASGVFTVKRLNPEQIKNLRFSTIEYTPIWVNNRKELISQKRKENVSVKSGKAIFHIAEWKSEKMEIIVKAVTPAVLRISTFYFPGWEAEIDSSKAEIIIEEGSGVMLIFIPEGDHTLRMRFIDTPIRYFSRLISLVSCMIIVFFAFFLRKAPQFHNRDKVGKIEA